MSKNDKNSTDSKFKVEDRRRFETDGSVRSGTDNSTKVDSETPSPSTGDQNSEDPTPFPELDFINFLMSLSTSALMALGAVPNEQGKQTTNQPMAHQTIDILEMLKEKTQGNLTADESKLLETSLFELRMRYVQVFSDKTTP